MRVVIDCEANALDNPTKIWLIVCKDIVSGALHKFRNVHEQEEANRFREFYATVELWIGHNVLGYDFIHVARLLPGCPIPRTDRVVDTLVISKLVDYSRQSGHSIESYGEEFGLSKGKFSDWSKYSQEMEDYCVRDVEICHRIYNKYLRYISNSERTASIQLEQRFQLLVNDLHSNGFAFDRDRCDRLLARVEDQLRGLDRAIQEEFPPRLRLIREVVPKLTKHGTLSRTDFRFVKDGDLSEYNGGPFSRCEWVDFNPASHKQVVDVLFGAGWKPDEKTATHKDLERELKILQRQKKEGKPVDNELTLCSNKLLSLKKYGFKINEHNLSTLPERAPSPARTLAKRILYEARRRTLTEWLGLVQDDNRIHGDFYGIGAWTHRMAHQRPNTANIPREFTEDGSVKFLGKEMRQLWRAPQHRLLVGVDAESIQLRIFAHYTGDEELIHAIVNGKKADKTDPHSVNRTVLGSACKTRQAAKRFLYALFLGGGLGRLASILGCSEDEASEALTRLLQQYPGFQRLKAEVIPADAKRGWFVGLDGRVVRIPGDTLSERRHLCMSGYLQNGEAVIVKKAAMKSLPAVIELGGMFVNIVHDEIQIECENNMQTAIKIGEIVANSIKDVGDELKLKCPMAGSFWNEDVNDFTIGTTWYATH